MKLSVERKLGWIQVRASRLLKVLVPHAVPTAGWNQLANRGRDLLERTKHLRFADGVESVTAQPGDLAIEMTYVKTGNLCGWSYLSGAAIQCDRYTTGRLNETSWFEPADGRAVELPTPLGIMRHLDVQAVFDQVQAVKYEVDVGVLELYLRTQDDAEKTGLMLGDMYARRSREEEARGHFLALIHTEKRTVVTAHFQPLKDISEWAATGFQHGLLRGLYPRSSNSNNDRAVEGILDLFDTDDPRSQL